jgi:Winged helix DNA-binding domain
VADAPVLTPRALNRALLARQLLLERAAAPLPAALERVGGIQAQYAPSMYVGLWSRLEGFAREDLTRALERREVIQGTLMRITIHLVSRADYWPMALATRAARRQWWLRSRRDGPREAEMAEAARGLRERLRAGPLPRREVEAMLGKAVANGVGLWVDLVRVPPSGTWERRRADLFAAAEDWLGPPDVSPEAAVEHLVRRYLAAFGPASAADVASWSGLARRELVPVLDSLAPERLRDEAGGELLDLPGAPRPPADTPAPVRFLPTWDATLLVHARRTGLLPEPYRPRVFSSKTPQSVPTFLVDGAVAGTWRHAGGGIALEPFERLDATTRRALDAEADRLTTLHA